MRIIVGMNFKCSLECKLQNTRASNLGHWETERRYFIVKSMLKNQERIYLEKGIDGLVVERRGRIRKMENHKIEIVRQSG